MRYASAAIVLACMSFGSAALADEPYAVIDGTDWPKTEPYSAPVGIASIDGKDYLKESRHNLAPGKHRLEFITLRQTRGHKFRQTRSIEIELKPCTIYYFYAKHPSKFADEWELTLMRESELKSCGQAK
jgi:hypothetical protein